MKCRPPQTVNYPSAEAIQRISRARSGKNNPFYGKRHPKTVIEIIRRTSRERRLGKVTPAFNPQACRVIDEYGRTHGYHFQHALNGGEVRCIGYSLDGYDKQNNVVIEYYERHHKKQVEQDAKRKHAIIKHLGCKFIEIKEWEQ